MAPFYHVAPSGGSTNDKGHLPCVMAGPYVTRE